MFQTKETIRISSQYVRYHQPLAETIKSNAKLRSEDQGSIETPAVRHLDTVMRLSSKLVANGSETDGDDASGVLGTATQDTCKLWEFDPHMGFLMLSV